MEINIRRAVAADCERIMELVQELAHYERAPEEVTISLEHFRESGFGPNPVWWGFVATSPVANPMGDGMGEAGELIHGFALYYIRFSTWKGQTLYLEDILVTEKMRGQKIGTLLFERLIQEAKEKGFARIAWQVLDWNQPAINFYKKYDATIGNGWLNGAIEIEP